MNFSNIKGFTRHLATLPAAVQHAQHAGLAAAGRNLTQHAKAMIGTENEKWPALAASTVEEKQRLGYTGKVSATDPLLRTGELRDSISAKVEGAKVVLGATDPIALFQELGTSRIPARSFIAATVFKEGHAAAHTVAAMAGRPPRSNTEKLP